MERHQGLPKDDQSKVSPVVKEEKKRPQRPRSVRTKNILSKNLFDPERGTGKTEATPVLSDDEATKRIRGMVLLGTAILGNSRIAILRQPPGPRRAGKKSRIGSPTGHLSTIRLKLGDKLEGYNLLEINEKMVIFTRGSSKVEISIDFLRKDKVIKKKRKAPAKTRRKPRRIPKKSISKG